MPKCSLLLLGGVLTAVLGCGQREAVKLFPVSGKVTFRGEPAANALVVFHDKRPRDELRNLPIPRARTDDDGSFRLSSYETNDGAPAGEYRVTVILPESALPSAEAAPPRDATNSTDNARAEELVIDPEAAGNPRDRLEDRYSDPETSGLEALVAEHENILPSFELN